MRIEATNQIGRRSFLAAVAGLIAAPRLFADERKPAADLITPDTQRAIDRGLGFLARSQAADGSFGDYNFQGNVAVTALCGLAFMAGGNQPGRGPYGSNVTKALQYVLSKESTKTPGFLYHESNERHGPMYSHGFGTLLLGELHGMVDDEPLAKRLRATLDRAVQLIIACQNSEGGWRYRPIKEQADVSVTICQMMALRSARNAGLAVPKSCADNCIGYVKACQAPDGGFRYQKGSGQTAFPRSAAGLCALYSAGMYEGQEVNKALKYLKQFKPGTIHRGMTAALNETHYYYGHYYAAQAFWTAGEPHWSDWFPAVRDDLVRNRQRSDGSWADTTFFSDYSTAMACIVLQIPNSYLPILQK